MSFNALLAYVAAFLTAGLAALALRRDPRSVVHRIFAAGMLLFAVESALSGFVYHAQSAETFLLRHWLRSIAASFLPAAWFLFSVSFTRTNYREQIAKWKWVLLAMLVGPVALVTLLHPAFYGGPPVAVDGGAIIIPVGWAGYLWHLLWIVAAVLILMNLERTFRHTIGHLRWQTKFMFLGIAGIFGMHLFADSQTILYKSINPGMDAISAGVLVVADVLVLRSFYRGRPLQAGVQLSHQFLYSSFTALIVGVYFIAVGVIAWLSLQFAWLPSVNIAIFFVFLAVVVVAAVLLSDRLRLKRKQFITRHFHRPQYDYQRIWARFTEQTASVTETEDLCNRVVRLVSDTLEVLSVSIWLVEGRQEHLSFGGSTVFTDDESHQRRSIFQGGADLIRAMADRHMPVDLEGREDDWVEDLRHTYGTEDGRESRVRYCVPIRAAGQLIGVMTLSEKVFYEPLTFEEMELLKNVADQVAAALLNLRLAERLRQAKELEAFQAMSAFFMHDLKNLSSKLSLVTQNLPVHLDNPEFRSDALRTISQCVAKINSMSGRLTLLSQKLELFRAETDVNAFIAAAVAGAETYLAVPVSLDLQEVPPIVIDREQINKVLENLLMNAHDAVGTDGRITVASALRDGWVELSVSDNGNGMSREFVEKHLFRPFQTTKKQGMGIGLYHCRTIVETHGGRIQVESEEGRGTTFRVLLPLTATKGDERYGAWGNAG